MRTCILQKVLIFRRVEPLKPLELYAIKTLVNMGKLILLLQSLDHLAIMHIALVLVDFASLIMLQLLQELHKRNSTKRKL